MKLLCECTFVTLALATTPVVAGTYKCTVNGQTTYSDVPCGDKAIVVRSAPAMEGASGSNIYRQLDARVISALSEGDIGRAESLAVTAEHWQLINQAKRDAAADAAVKRAELDRAKQLRATQAATDATNALAKQNARPIQCVSNSYTSGGGNSYGGTTGFGATTSGTTVCR